MPILQILFGLAQFAPQIAQFFGKGEDAAKAVASIAQQVSGATSPEDALKQIQASSELQQKFQQEVMANETKLQEMYLADIQSARERDVKIQEAGGTNKRANWIAALAFILVALCLAVVVGQSNLDDAAKAIINLILGRALGWVEQVFSYEFGTTRQSKTKDETISKLSGS